MQEGFREVQLICRLLRDTDEWDIINRMKYHWGWINLRLLFNNETRLRSNSFNIARTFFSVWRRHFIFRDDKVTLWLYKPALALAMDSGSTRNPRGGQGTASPQVHFIQQPIAQQPEVTILQQMPWTPSALPPSSRTGQIREDLMDLMMIQNAQMHQVIMNNLAVSAVADFGYNLGQPTAQVSQTPWQVEEEDEDEPMPLVFHHHYAPYPSNIPFTAWRPQSQSMVLPPQQPTIRHVGPTPPQATGRQDGPVVPPPPPPSATGTVTADVPPASEYYDFAEGRK